MADKKELLWLDKYPISHEDDKHGLDTRAAIHEFSNKMPRHEAEEQAHKDYKHEQAVDGAAHHFNGMKAAFSSGDTESSKKHAIMYTLACQAMGHKDHLHPPDEVLNRVKHTPSKVYSFKNHKSDIFLLQPKSEDSKSETKE